MKLRTKFQDEDFELGEVVDANMIYSGDARQGFKVVAIAKAGGQCSFYYSSIKDFTDHWEDAPEPKGYWYIRDDGSGVGFSPLDYSTVAHRRLIIGNYFESEVEAKRAEEKLKAGQRLKGLGTEILGWEIRDMPTGGGWQTVNVKLNIKARKEPMELLDLLFCTEDVDG